MFTWRYIDRISSSFRNVPAPDHSSALSRSTTIPAASSFRRLTATTLRRPWPGP